MRNVLVGMSWWKTILYILIIAAVIYRLFFKDSNGQLSKFRLIVLIFVVIAMSVSVVSFLWSKFKK